MLKDDTILLDKILERKNLKYLKNEDFFWLYPFTNENINEYFSRIDFDDKSVLTITSSGDHILNAILLGAKNIDAFDSNPLSKYYAELKVAGVKSLSYEEFLLFFYNKNVIRKNKYHLNNKIYERNIRKNLNGDSKTFWDYVFKTYSSNKLYASVLFTDDFLDLVDLIKVNKYLKKSNYYELKNKLSDVIINYYDMDILDLKNIDKQYDVIILSNVPAFLDIESIEEKLRLLKNTIDNLTKEDSTVVVCYLYGNSSFSYANQGIYNKELVNRIFSSNNYEYHNFSSSDTLSYRGFMKKLYDGNDSVLITKNKILKKTYDE